MTLPFEHLGIDLKAKLIVAVSGGSDSVALLKLLKEAGFEYLIVAHMDHQMREASSTDAQFVQGMAEELSLPFELKQVDIPSLTEDSGGNLEATGREQRYSWFRELKSKHTADYIVTAHHADDQVETVLMNMVRGCGLDGLTGMKELDHDLWRPLLETSKQQLLAYCEERDLSFVEDESNEDLKYRRNFLRSEVVPKLKELNPNLLETMSGNIRVWRQSAEALMERVQDYLEEERVKDLRFRLQPFLGLDRIEQQLVLREIYAEIHGSKKDFMQDHMDQVMKVLQTNVSGKQKEFGTGRVIVRQRDYFEIRGARI